MTFLIPNITHLHIYNSCNDLGIRLTSYLLLFNCTPRHEGVSWKWKYSFTHFLTSALGGGELSASRYGRFTHRERAPGTHWIGGWVHPRSGLDTVVKRKIPSPCWDSNPRSSGP